VNEPAHRARLLYRRDPKPPPPPAGYILGGAFTKYLLNSIFLVFVVLVVVALIRRETAFLSLCFLSVAPFLFPLPWLIASGGRQEGKREAGAATKRPKRRPRRPGRAAREISRLKAATEENLLGYRVEGEGAEAWVTRRGCFMTDGSAFTWGRIASARWEDAADENLRLRLVVSSDLARLAAVWLLLIVVPIAMTSGSLISVHRVLNSIPDYGLRVDLVAVAWLNLFIWVACFVFVLSVVRYVSRPWRGGQLLVLVHCGQTTREDVISLVPARLREQLRAG